MTPGRPDDRARPDRATRGSVVEEALEDARHALRQMRRSPGFASVVIVTLAVAVGAVSAVFSVVNGVLLEPLPYEAPEELVTVDTAFPSQGFDRFWVSPPEYFELREWNRAFEELGAWRVGSRAVETYDEPLQVPSAVATWSLFPTLGVHAALGRTFTEAEDLPGAEPVVLVSHDLWTRAFGRDRAVLGRTIRVDGEAATVVGVLPEGFDLEDAGVDVWLPMNAGAAGGPIDPSDHVNRRGNHFMNVVARLADGVSLDEARAELDRLELRWEEEYGTTHAVSPDGHPVQAYDFRMDVLGDVRPALLLLLGAVGFVLLIACANVASLFLARAEGRTQEVAVRVAFGAGRGRLARQLLVEGLTFSLVGGVVGLLLGHVALDAILQINPEAVPRLDRIGMDGTVIAFTAAVTAGTGLLFGLAPLLGSTPERVGATLKESGARSTWTASAVRARRFLVVGEVALAVVLLTGSGLMLRSLAALQEVDLGFDPENLLTMRVTLPETTYPGPLEVGRFFGTLTDRIESLPGVVSASATSGVPPVRTLIANDTEFEGVPRTPDGPAHNVDYWTGVEPGFLRTMGIEVVEGRGFERSDGLAETPVMLVNERLARTFYPDRSPVGRRIRPPGAPSWFTVVGVVEDVKQAGVDAEVGTELYFYHPQLTGSGLFAYRTMDLVVRTEGAPLSLAPSVRRTVAELDGSLPVADVRSMEQNVARSMAQPRFLSLLLGAFAAIALVLAAVGTYGVMSYSVAERNREIGIRMAVGAGSGDVLGMVVRQGGGLAGAGLALGVLGALALTRFLSSQLYEVGATDAGTFVAAPLFLGAVALAACYLPARRATRVDPVTALREEQ